MWLYPKVDYMLQDQLTQGRDHECTDEKGECRLGRPLSGMAWGFGELETYLRRGHGRHPRQKGEGR